MGRTTRVTVEGHAYDIPDMWLIGMTHRQRFTVEQAVQHWHDQAMMAEAFEAQRAAAA